MFDNGCFILAGLGLFLLIITFVGHGLWLLMAAIFRLFRQNRVCPNCRRPGFTGRCVACGWPDRVPGNLAVQRYLSDLVQEGRITVQVYQRVMDGLENRQPSVGAGVLPTATMTPVFQSQSPPPVPPPLPSLPIDAIETKAEQSPTAMDLHFLGPSDSQAQIEEPLPLAQPAVEMAPPPPPAPPRKPLAEIMASFMEEKNIRWGELVGGLLIVGCSVALAISLWSQISHYPVLKFLVFTLVTAAMFGLGLYSHHRWKLPMTSRGILVTATLLVPLTILASAAFSQNLTENALAPASQGFSLLLFAWLLWLAGRVIAPDWPVLMAAGVVLESACLPLIRYAPSGVAPLFLAALPVACYEAVSVGFLARSRRWLEPGSHQGHAILRMLGIISFAMLLPLGLTVHKSGLSWETLNSLSPLLSLASLPALATGLLMWRRLRDPALVALRAAGTAVAVLGAMLLVAAIVFSWPQAACVLPVAVIDGLLLVGIALAFELPEAYLPAGVCLVPAYLIAFHLAGRGLPWRGDEGQMLDALFAGSCAVALLPLVALLALLSVKLRRIHRPKDAAWIVATAAIAAFFSLCLVTRDAYFTDGSHAAVWVYAVYAAAAFFMAWETQKEPASLPGWILGLFALQQLLKNASLACDDWLLAMLIDATAAAVLYAVSRRYPRLERSFAKSAAAAVLVASIVAVLLLVAMMQKLSFSALACNAAALRVLWVAAIAELMFAVEGELPLFNVFQAALTASVLLVVTARLLSRDWFTGDVLSDPRALLAYAIPLAAMGLIWTLLRAGQTKLTSITGRFMPESGLWSVDRIVTCFILLALCILAVQSVAGGIAGEFDSAGGPKVEAGAVPVSVYASGIGSWILLVILAVVALLEIRQRPGVPALLIFILIAFAACPLLAARWEGVNATASALRWIAAVFLLIATVPVWARDRVRRLKSLLDERSILYAGHFVLFLGATSILALTLTASGLAICSSPPIGPAKISFFHHIGNSISYMIPLLLLLATLVGHAFRQWSAPYAFAAGLVLNLTVTLGYLLAHVAAPLTGAQAIDLIQLNIVAVAGYALAWLAVRRMSLGPMESARPAPGLLHAQVWVAVAAVIALVIPATLVLLAVPDGSSSFPLEELVSLYGCLATLLVGVAAAWLLTMLRRRIGAGTIAVSLMVAATMIAAAVSELRLIFAWDPWAAYRALLAGDALAAWAVLGFGRMLLMRQRGVVLYAEELPVQQPARAGEPDGPAPIASAFPTVLEYQRRPSGQESLVLPEVLYRDRDRATRWALGIGAFVVLLALRIAPWDPLRPWWSAAGILSVSALAATIACWLMARRFVYVAGSLFSLAANIWWLCLYWQWARSSLVDLLHVNVIALAIPAAAWLVLELQVFRPRGLISRGLPYHALAAWVCLAAQAFVVVLALAARGISLFCAAAVRMITLPGAA